MKTIIRSTLVDLFAKLDDAAPRPMSLCVIGAAAVLLYGHTARQTQDIDIWAPASDIKDRELSRMSAAAGIDYDPRHVDPERIYIQIVQPGIVVLPGFSDGKWATGDLSKTLWSGDRLTIVAPPASIVIASKLVRGDDRDIDDSVFLLSQKTVDLGHVAKAIAKFDDIRARETARENMTILEIIIDRSDGRIPRRIDGPER